jgi:hypothetical protein
VQAGVELLAEGVGEAGDFSVAGHDDTQCSTKATEYQGVFMDAGQPTGGLPR